MSARDWRMGPGLMILGRATMIGGRGLTIGRLQMTSIRAYGDGGLSIRASRVSRGICASI